MPCCEVRSSMESILARGNELTNKMPWGVFDASIPRLACANVEVLLLLSVDSLAGDQNL